MSATNVSVPEAKAAFEERVAMIRTVVHQRLQHEVSIVRLTGQYATYILLEVETVSPLGRDSNNYVNLVQLKKTDLIQDAHHDLPLQYGTHKLDLSVVKIVVRSSNSNVMLDEEVRVENEVAAITLMHRALANLTYRPVPKVYAWEASSSTGHGWIAEEFMDGEKLSLHLPDLSMDEKIRILDQVAEIFEMIQAFDPKTDGFGGLRFDENGRVVAQKSSLWSVGPFQDYASMYPGIFDKRLELVATTPLLNGWNEGGLSERLRHFNESGGLKSLLHSFESTKFTLVHGDICQYSDNQLST
jgi:hypothetical protein